MILSSYMILHATENSRITMQEKMGTKVVIEVKEGSQVITENEIRTIRDLGNEDTYNLYADYTASFYLDFYLIPYFKTIRIPQHIIDPHGGVW